MKADYKVRIGWCHAPKWMMVELPLYLILAWKAGKMVERSRAGSK